MKLPTINTAHHSDSVNCVLQNTDYRGQCANTIHTTDITLLSVMFQHITKRRKARVTIEGQCVLLQISLQIKMFDFLLNSQNHRMTHIFPGILLNP